MRKSEDEAKDGEPASTSGAAKSPLQVTVPTELEGVAYIQVTIKSIPGWFWKVGLRRKINKQK